MASKYKKLSKKQKQKLALKLIVFLVVCLISLGSFLYYKATTQPSLESVISNISFDTSKVTLDVTLSNQNETIHYLYVVSDEDNYIKSVKTINQVSETNIVYQEDSQYYLYVDKGTPAIVSLNTNDALAIINNLKTQITTLEDYLDINYSTVKYYKYSKESLIFSNTKDGVFYDNEILISNNMVESLKQTYTIGNLINIVTIDIDYTVSIEIPTI